MGRKQPISPHMAHQGAASIQAAFYIWADIVISESASPLQALSDALLEHGLVADSDLFGDPARLFEVGDRDTN